MGRHIKIVPGSHPLPHTGYSYTAEDDNDMPPMGYCERYSSTKIQICFYWMRNNYPAYYECSCLNYSIVNASSLMEWIIIQGNSIISFVSNREYTLLQQWMLVQLIIFLQVSTSNVGHIVHHPILPTVEGRRELLGKKLCRLSKFHISPAAILLNHLKVILCCCTNKKNPLHSRFLVWGIKCVWNYFHSWKG